MTAQPGLAVSRDGSSNGTTPKSFRLAVGSLLAKNGASGLDVRKGVLWDNGGPVVTGAADMSYNIRSCNTVVMPSSTQGPVIVPNDASVNVATTAAPGSNSRIDVIWVRQHLVAADGGADTDVIGEIGVTQGTAAASPTAPAIPTGAVELARSTVTSGTTATNTLTISQTHLWTCADGAPIPVRNDTERNALSPFDGLMVNHLANHKLQRYDGSGWRTVAQSEKVVASGSDSGSPAAGAGVTVPVSFGVTFATTPNVVATLQGSSAVANLLRLAVSNVTTTGCNVNLWRDSGSTTSITFGWMAQG